MKLFLLILGLVVVALNIFLWYSKKHGDAAKANQASDSKSESEISDTAADESFNSQAANALKKSAAAELGISIEQLNRMSAEEIESLASEKGLI